MAKSLVQKEGVPDEVTIKGKRYEVDLNQVPGDSVYRLEILERGNSFNTVHLLMHKEDLLALSHDIGRAILGLDKKHAQNP